MADVVAPPDLGQRLASCPTHNGFLYLMGRELGLATEPHPPRLCPLAPFIRPSLDQLAFKLGKAARTVSISRPCGVVVSAQPSAIERKPAPFVPIASITLSRSRVERASRSSRVTSNTSPAASEAIAFASCFRSV
jgi:hypothetical protein